MSPLTDPLGPDLTATLRALKLGKLTATLPERLTLARVDGAQDSMAEGWIGTGEADGG